MAQTSALARQPASGIAKAGEATRQAIIDTAKKMFSDRRITAVSLRSILAEFGTNTAAAHYHFGSKENLIAEVFARRAKRVADKRMHRLDGVLKRPNDSTRLKEIIRAFIEPGFFSGADTREASKQFARLRARLMTDDSDLTVRLLSDGFDESSHRYMKALSDALTDLSKIDVQWRFRALLGVMVYTVTGPARTQSLTNNTCNPSDLHAAVEHLVPTLSGMFRAPPTFFAT